MTTPEQEEFEFRLRAERETPATPQASPPWGAVVANATAKAEAGLGDMFLNAPANAWNLGQGAIGFTKQLFGHENPWLDTHIIKPPNLVENAFRKAGLIKDDAEPQGFGQRLLDTGVQGAVGGGAGPGNVISGMVKGATSGLAGQAVKERTGSDAAAIATSLLTPFAVRGTFGGRKPSLNDVQLQTAREGQAAGYRLPPSEINPSFLENRLESFAGKAATKQQAVPLNQVVTNRLASEEIGVNPKEALTETVFKRRLAQEGKPYAEVSELKATPEMDWHGRYHHTGRELVDQMKQARADAVNIRKGLLTKYDPDAIKRAETLENLADSLEGDIGTLAEANGKPELVKALADARVKIAKIHDVWGATNQTGEVSAKVLGPLGDKKKLTGNLDLISKYEQTFPKFMGEEAKSPTPGVSAVEPLAAGGFGLAGQAAFGPWGWLAAGVPMARGGVRSALLSRMNQKRLLGDVEGLGDTATRSALINALVARQEGATQ